MVDGGTILIKLWLEVGNDEQKKRFEARLSDPLRQWKLSPMDLPSRKRWYDYSRARDHDAEGHRHELRAVAHRPIRRQAGGPAQHRSPTCSSAIPHKKLPRDPIELPRRSNKGAYDDSKSIARRRFIKERY